MLQSGVYVDSGVLCIVLDGCSKCNNLESGLQVHGLALKLGHVSQVNIGTALIDLYAAGGSKIRNHYKGLLISIINPAHCCLHPNDSFFVGQKISEKDSIKLSDTNSSEKGHIVKASTIETVAKMHSLEDYQFPSFLLAPYYTEGQAH
ncbi:hypothetical protein K1719_000765 [Acacia pycnantha]|nr:hypothetical protein K1719_000765 [Acacia pycnantha]